MLVGETDCEPDIGNVPVVRQSRVEHEVGEPVADHARVDELPRYIV